MRALAHIYENYTQVVAKQGSGIETIADLKGKKVSVGAPNSGTEVIADRVLEEAGIDPKSGIKREGLGVDESVQAMKDGSIDAFFWSGGLPTAAVMELAATPGVSIRLLSDAELVPRLTETHGPLYGVLEVPEGVYRGVPAVRVSTVRNLMMVRRDMPEDLAYRITRLLFEKKAELAAAHAAARDLDPARAAVAPVPLHPGAIRYFREAGVWKDAR